MIKYTRGEIRGSKTESNTSYELNGTLVQTAGTSWVIHSIVVQHIFIGYPVCGRNCFRPSGYKTRHDSRLTTKNSSSPTIQVCLSFLINVRYYADM